jgi:hypothetical protein
MALLLVLGSLKMLAAQDEEISPRNNFLLFIIEV